MFSKVSFWVKNITILIEIRIWLNNSYNYIAFHLYEFALKCRLRCMYSLPKYSFTVSWNRLKKSSYLDQRLPWPFCSTLNSWIGEFVPFHEQMICLCKSENFMTNTTPASKRLRIFINWNSSFQTPIYVLKINEQYAHLYYYYKYSIMLGTYFIFLF